MSSTEPSAWHWINYDYLYKTSPLGGAGDTQEGENQQVSPRIWKSLIFSVPAEGPIFQARGREKWTVTGRKMFFFKAASSVSHPRESGAACLREKTWEWGEQEEVGFQAQAPNPSWRKRWEDGKNPPSPSALDIECRATDSPLVFAQ